MVAVRESTDGINEIELYQDGVYLPQPCSAVERDEDGEIRTRNVVYREALT